MFRISFLRCSQSTLVNLPPMWSRTSPASPKSPKFAVRPSSCCHQPWSGKCGKLRASIYGFAGFFPFRHVYLVCILMHLLSVFIKSKYSLTDRPLCISFISIGNTIFSALNKSFKGDGCQHCISFTLYLRYHNYTGPCPK